MSQVIAMPKLSDTMSVGTLVKWLKKEGDVVKFGDLIAEIETDKATMEFESFFDGTILKLYAEAGSQIAVGEPLCAVGQPGETAPAATTPAAPAPAPTPKPEAKPAPAPGPSAPPVAQIADLGASSADARLKISPLAKKLAAAKGIDASRLQGTGPGGRIVRADIEAAKNAPQSQISNLKSQIGAISALSAKGPIQEERTVPVSNMRGVIAKRLLEAKNTIPHFYLEIEVDAEPLGTLRQQLNAALEKDGVKLSVNDFILKASAEALRRVPAVNASWEGTHLRFHGAAHVSFAVAIEDGLITPVVRDTHLKSVFAISQEAKTLGKLAKDKKLKPDQFTGGTFCVSNLGMMGVDRFSAIINPPNAAILAVGATVKKPVVKNDEIVIGQRMTLTLSADHRVVDGAVAAQFMAALKQIVETPALLLI